MNSNNPGKREYCIVLFLPNKALRLIAIRAAFHSGQTGYPRTVINEGLRFDPNNEDLMELQKQVEGN